MSQQVAEPELDVYSLFTEHGNKPDHVERVDIDHVIDAWYESAPLFPGDEPGCLWRDHPHHFVRRSKS